MRSRTTLTQVAANPAAAGLADTQDLRRQRLDQRLAAAARRPATNPMGVDWFAMVFGLGFVLSFGYWCTNFLVVQRAMAAKNMTAARHTPLIAAVPKMIFPVLVILPGMIAAALAFIRRRTATACRPKSLEDRHGRGRRGEKRRHQPGCPRPPARPSPRPSA